MAALEQSLGSACLADLYAHKTASGRASNRRSALGCETVIIAEMTARRLIAHAARYFLTAS
jgi:hypothetical protein